MSEQLICITCPLGCHLSIDRQGDGTLAVAGNRCPRGVRYANEELLAPKRVVSATARLAEMAGGLGEGLGAVARLPVRTSAAYPKDGVPALLAEIYRLTVSLPVSRGDVLIKDYAGSGVDVIATRSLP